MQRPARLRTRGGTWRRWCSGPWWCGCPPISPPDRSCSTRASIPRPRSRCVTARSPSARCSRRRARCTCRSSTRSTCSAGAPSTPPDSSRSRPGSSSRSPSTPPAGASAARESALLAAALVATTGSILWTTAPLTGDGPAAAFAALAVLGAFAWRDQPSSLRAILTGIAMGAALAVKVLVAVAAIPIGLIFLLARRGRDLALAVAAAVAVIGATILPWGVSRVIDQSVTYHTDAPRIESVGQQFNKLFSTLPSRDLPLIAAVVLGFVAAAVTTRRKDGEPALGGARRGDRARVARPPPRAPRVREEHVAPAHRRGRAPARAARRAPAPSAQVVRDRAHRPRPVVGGPPGRHPVAPAVSRRRGRGDRGDAVPSEGHVGHQRRARPGVARGAADAGEPRRRIGAPHPRAHRHHAGRRAGRRRPRVCAVVVWSTRYGHDLPGLPAALQQRGYTIEHRYGGVRAYWRKHTPACNEA